jgi:clan AA aspartic protease
VKGEVDGSGRAIVRVALQGDLQSPSIEVDFWIDTGFTGDVVLPQSVILGMGLVQSGSVGAQLGDGSRSVMRTYTCVIDWFGKKQQIEVIANDGEWPLLGVGLLLERSLLIEYGTKSLSIH